MRDSAGKAKTGVLIIVENLPVPFDRRVWQEACALRDAGYEVSVICPRMKGFLTPEETLDGIFILRHGMAAEGRGLPGFLLEYLTALWGECWGALRIWQRRPFQIIHLCNPPDLLFLVALPFKLLAGVKIVYDVHDLVPEMYEAKFRRRGFLYWLVRLAERATAALADRILATNESVQRIMRQRAGRSGQDVTVVRTAPQGMDTGIAPLPALKKGRAWLAAYVGVMGDADGIDYALEAAAHIVHQRQRQDVQFLLMGNGPEYQRLLEKRNNLGLADFVDMPGRVSNTALFQGLQTMDLGVTCDPINRYNDHCTMNKVLEYMSFAKPQVMFATTEGRFSAGEAAVYVEENSAVLLGNAILALLDDPAQRAKLGLIGRERMEKELNWEHSTRALLSVYRQVTA